MKRLTRHGYLVDKRSLTASQIAQIKQELTMIPENADYMETGDIKSFPAFKEDSKFLAVPRFYGIQHFGEPDINRLDKCQAVRFNYLGKLYENQVEHVSKTLKGLKERGGGLLIAGCGLGKTNMALYIASKMRVKTLFIVHTKQLCKQIRERAEKFTDVKSFGIIRGPHMDVDHPIVIGTVQTISKDKYPSSIYKDFGLVIIDEVHHMAAETFSKAYSIVGSKYVLGISAESSRKDGLYRLIKWHMGDILTFQDQPPNNMVIVKRFEYSTDDHENIAYVEIKGKNRSKSKPNLGKMETNLTKIDKRNQFIALLLEQLYELNRTTLFLSCRVAHAEHFQKVPVDSGMYVSKTPQKDKDESVKKRLILSVYQMAKEALDIPTLDTVVFAAPITDPKQPVGRILRKKHYDDNPVVIDIVDVSCPTFKNRSYARNRYYRSKEYQIQTFQVTDIPDGKGIQYNDADSIRECLLTKEDTAEITEEEEEVEYAYD